MRVRLAATSLATALPTTVEPVRAMWSTPGYATSACPTAGPRPVTTLKTPGRNPASRTRLPSSRADTVGESDGFTTNTQPAVNAGASFHISSKRGEFHGTMAPSTPTASSRV